MREFQTDNDGVDVAIGLVIAFHDEDGDGTFTPAPVKPGGARRR